MSDILKRFSDRQEARAGSYVSRAAAAITPLGDRLIACEHQRAVRVGYRLARNGADTVAPEAWSRFDGDPRAGRWPNSYRTVGTVLGNVAILDAVRERETSLSLAVGWTHKGSILVGVLPDELELSEDDAGNYGVGMRVGQGVLQTAFGVYDPIGREFTVPSNVSSAGPTYSEVWKAPDDLVIL